MCQLVIKSEDKRKYANDPFKPTLASMDVLLSSKGYSKKEHSAFYVTVFIVTRVHNVDYK